jgi:cytochrome b561
MDARMPRSTSQRVSRSAGREMELVVRFLRLLGRIRVDVERGTNEFVDAMNAHVRPGVALAAYVLLRKSPIPWRSLDFELKIKTF